MLTGASGCGPLTWFTAQAYTFLTFTTDPSLTYDLLVKLESLIITEVGSYPTLEICGSYDNYPTLGSLCVPLPVTIVPCILVGYTPLTSLQTTASYTIATPALTFSLGQYSPTPACTGSLNYSVLVDGSATYPSWFTADLVSALTFTINE